jgi:hypothetical protein
MSDTQIRLAQVLQISEKTIADAEKLKKTLNARIVGVGLGTICNRCAGSGSYSYNQTDGTVCYGCKGKGFVAPKVTEALIAKAEEAVNAGKLTEYLEGLKKAKQKPTYAIALDDMVSRTSGKVITKGKKYKVTEYHKNKDNTFTVWIDNDHGNLQGLNAKNFELIYE